MTSADVSPVSGAGASADAAAPVTDTNSQVQGGASSTLNGSTKLSTMDDIKKESPKLYNMMMQGIATNICNSMKDGQERIKKIMRESRQG